ncbi:MAG: glycosyltransferase [Prevotellaceae bacterium]|jgi:glycosyltransferase involved in cell wall biosynthesis|nr:glycosyltransferase [Prevotellaceae bacterium]
MYKLTIFTPTYNRAYILGQLYDSLCRQTKPDFKWLIVDDGSTDNTRELVEQWQAEQKIDMRYIWQENGGKMRAHNNAVLHCETELFICVDSDDYLTANAVELIYSKWEEVKSLSNISGIVAYRGWAELEHTIGTIPLSPARHCEERSNLENSNHNIIKKEFPAGVETSALLKLYQHGFSGDTSLVFRTEILKQYLFPEIAGEKFITEAYVYDQIDQHYRFAILRQPLIMCQYQPDGYTQHANKLFKENPKGWALYYNQRAKYSIRLKEKLVLIAKYVCFSLMAKNKHIIKNSNFPFLTLCCFPLGYYYKIRRYEK